MVQTMYIHLASGVQHMPRTSAWSLVAAPPTDINIGSISSTDHRHPHGFQCLHGMDIHLATSCRRTTNLNMTLISNMDH